MIEDAKLRELFKAESDEHLQRLDDAFLRLEKTPADQALLEEAFREAHSLKGAARMLGLSAIQAPAHRLEDELNAARRGTQALDLETIDRLSGELVEIRRLVADALADGGGDMREAAPVKPTISQFSAASPATSSLPPGDALPAPETEAATPGAPPSAPFRIGSVRVDTRKLDALMTHAGELVVTRTRVARRVADIDALIDLVEDWARSDSAERSGSRATPVGAAPERRGRIGALLARLRAGLSEDSARLDYIAGELESGIRLVRLLPLSNVFRLFPRLVHDLGQEQGKEVELVIEGEDTNADKRILEEIKDPLMHMLRNAVDHGIEAPQEREGAGKARTGIVRIKANHTPSSVTIEVSDDGRGLDEAAIKRAAIKRGVVTDEALAAMDTAQVQALIFAPGMSTADFVTDVSGRGVGMGVVRANAERLKGSIRLQSIPGKGTSFTMVLPVTLATVRVLIVEVNGHPYGLPAECVQVLKMVSPSEVFAVEGRDAVLHQGQPVSVARLADLLELPQATQRGMGRDAAAPAPCAVLSVGSEAFGVFVDALLDEQEVVLKPQSALLARVRNVAGATILDSGEICMVLNTQDLLASMRKGAAPAAPSEIDETAERKKAILLAEDSITTRTQEARILENAGYEVVTAVDGLEAWNKLATRAFHAVVTDVMMPNLDGLGLAEKIRRETRYAGLPIILVTSLASDADKKRGLEAGANAYITKPAFDQKILLDCLKRLI
ncbi:MAG TPA: hybrid sensor histidine kinase/response regulator [Burkholderiales bacterium]|nr:hybrid sensor histidine kinase/response regulator [Burkholderiales bacterium]